jgi:hypothetical protein
MKRINREAWEFVEYVAGGAVEEALAMNLAAALIAKRDGTVKDPIKLTVTVDQARDLIEGNDVSIVETLCDELDKRGINYHG